MADFGLYLVLQLMMTSFEFHPDLRHQKIGISIAIVWCCFYDAMFSRFGRTSICDRQTDREMNAGDGRTQGHIIYRTSIASCCRNGRFALLVETIDSGLNAVFINRSHCELWKRTYV